MDLIRQWMRIAGGLAVVSALAGCAGGPDRGAAVVAQGEPEVFVMNFARPPSLDPMAPGWYHRKFWTRAPMEMSLAAKDGVPAIRVATKATTIRRVCLSPSAPLPARRAAWRSSGATRR